MNRGWPPLPTPEWYTTATTPLPVMGGGRAPTPPGVVWVGGGGYGIQRSNFNEFITNLKPKVLKIYPNFARKPHIVRGHL